MRVAQVALHARVHCEAIYWVILADRYNVLNTVKRTGVFAEAATYIPALTPFVAKSYGERPAPVFLQIASTERRKIECSGGVQQGGAMGPALFCMSLLRVLKRLREEPRSVEPLPTSMTSAAVCQRSHRTL